ncbi:MAG TPA: LuxR family transcriptional regulator [Rhodospirillaceae bacterium]|nr:MAG: LuxR family transcriptional regulator [Alphaproteobacteria bacterium GWF2_58_20]HAU28736.1 LuxR family transcriptional regulator [Rhodospirillaceae bacterium]
MLVDSHCHLDFPDFAADIAGVVARAQTAGVGHMLTVATTLRASPGVIAVAGRFSCVSASVGQHPHHAAEEPDVKMLDWVALARNPKVVAIGECGLDYFYDQSPRDMQQNAFRVQIRACLETGLPILIHTRDAEEDTMRILREETAGQKLSGVLHCFTGSRKMADEALEFGFYISMSGILTFPKSEALRETAMHVPMDRLLVETDAPFLAPVPFRGKTNEPAFVVHTAALLAGIRGVSPDVLANVTTANFKSLFPKAVLA